MTGVECLQGLLEKVTEERDGLTAKLALEEERYVLTCMYAYVHDERVL